MYVVFFLGLAVVFSAASLIRRRKELSALRIVETVLLYLFIFNVGCSGLFAFWGHAFFADRAAASIGWAPGSPFQFEVAVANLAFGVLGMLCIFFRDNFWLATGVGCAVFLLGAAAGHIREMLTAGNYAVNNAGPVLYLGDITIPVLILVLLAVRRRLAPARRLS
ncbi:MAG: hypothetical protein GXY72_04235 [Deltaproteobacteria bacterium]|nr:hypothetical protein [Deltaproteobacteria bacterium]